MRVRRASWRAAVGGFLAVLSAALAALTLLSPAWVERTTGLDPDGGSGSVEVAIVAVLVVLAVVVGGYSVGVVRRALVWSGAD
jgi:hypothetical protein